MNRRYLHYRRFIQHPIVASRDAGLQAFLRSLSLTSSNSASSTSSLGCSLRPPLAPPASPPEPAPPAPADCSYIFCMIALEACSSAWVLRSMSSRSSPLIAVLTAAIASVAGLLLVLGDLVAEHP